MVVSAADQYVEIFAFFHACEESQQQQQEVNTTCFCLTCLSLQSHSHSSLSAPGAARNLLLWVFPPGRHWPPGRVPQTRYLLRVVDGHVTDSIFQNVCLFLTCCVDACPQCCRWERRSTPTVTNSRSKMALSSRWEADGSASWTPGPRRWNTLSPPTPLCRK